MTYDQISKVPTDFVDTENPTAAAVLVEVNLRVVFCIELGCLRLEIPWIFRESSLEIMSCKLWVTVLAAVFSGPWRPGRPAATESKSNATCVRFSTETGVSSQLPVVPPLKKHALTSRAFFCWYPKVNRLQNSQIRVGGVVSALVTFRYRLRISKRFAKFRQSSKMEARTKLTDVALDGDRFLTQLSGLSGIQCPQISVWEVPQ